MPTALFNGKSPMKSIQSIKEAAKTKKAELGRLFQDKYYEYKGALQDAATEKKKNLENMKRTCEHAIEQGRENIRVTTKQMNKSAHKEPWKLAGGVALGAAVMGFALGWLVKKKD